VQLYDERSDRVRRYEAKQLGEIYSSLTRASNRIDKKVLYAKISDYVNERIPPQEFVRYIEEEKADERGAYAVSLLDRCIAIACGNAA
jgi:hypothetical protein